MLVVSNDSSCNDFHMAREGGKGQRKKRGRGMTETEEVKRKVKAAPTRLTAGRREGGSQQEGKQRLKS